MSSMFDGHFLTFPRFHSPSLLSSTSSLQTPTWTTLPSNSPATITRNEEHCGRLVLSIPLTGYEPTEPDEVEVTHNLSIFHSPSVTSIYDLGENSTASPDQENHDEHIRNTLASPLCLQEREASADLSQVHHFNEESLLPGLTVGLCKREETRDNVLTEKEI